MTFSNMPSVLSQESWTSQVIDVVVSSLSDSQIEVRSKAGVVLSSLFHAGFIAGEKKAELLVRGT